MLHAEAVRVEALHAVFRAASKYDDPILSFGHLGLVQAPGFPDRANLVEHGVPKNVWIPQNIVVQYRQPPYIIDVTTEDPAPEEQNLVVVYEVEGRGLDSELKLKRNHLPHIVRLALDLYHATPLVFLLCTRPRLKSCHNT